MVVWYLNFTNGADKLVEIAHEYMVL